MLAHHPVLQQVFHLMGFEVGSPVGIRLEAVHTFRTNKDFLETDSVLETTSSKRFGSEDNTSQSRSHRSKDEHTLQRFGYTT